MILRCRLLTDSTCTTFRVSLSTFAFQGARARAYTHTHTPPLNPSPMGAGNSKCPQVLLTGQHPRAGAGAGGRDGGNVGGGGGEEG